MFREMMVVEASLENVVIVSYPREMRVGEENRSIEHGI
jgi:hypothetical protein